MHPSSKLDVELGEATVKGIFRQVTKKTNRYCCISTLDSYQIITTKYTIKITTTIPKRLSKGISRLKAELVRYQKSLTVSSEA